MIFLDTNVVSETLKKAPEAAVIAWLVRHDAELALPTAPSLKSLSGFRRPGRISAPIAWRRDWRAGVTGSKERLAYDVIMGDAARRGRGMSAPDRMVAAIAKINGGRLAIRNLKDFQTTGLDLISPWRS